MNAPHHRINRTWCTANPLLIPRSGRNHAKNASGISIPCEGQIQGQKTLLKIPEPMTAPPASKETVKPMKVSEGFTLVPASTLSYHQKLTRLHGPGRLFE
jgi:hypothetical protein